MEVDHAAFPWLWWNSQEEFDWYLGVPGVEAYVLLEGERVVAYAGLTISGRQGHLDRLAVHPDVQTRGYGRALVLFVLQRMAARRVERVALTTQVDNYKSAGLYTALGFVRTAIRYPIYGVWLKDEDPRSLA
jgi:ribosomal-protein-alanine N-acetyltransferase